jgi:predicted nucleic acid-binding protein
MSIDRETLLFFDASCLIAAAGSQTGGSAFLLSICERRFLRAAVSQIVLIEAERNILDKMTTRAFIDYRERVAGMLMLVAPVPSEGERQQFRGAVGEKDDHVLASCVLMGVEFLISLDKKLVDRVNAHDSPLRAFTPGDFIKSVLPTHVDYPSLRG